MLVKSPKVLHRRSRRAKKKQQKSVELLREVMIPPNQFTLTCEQIDSNIIVFDGSDPNSPPIKPPDGVQWQSLSVRMLHIPDDHEPNIGPTAPRMDDDVPAFIRLPRQMSLDIIGDVDLEKILSSLTACKPPCPVVMRRVFSLTTVSVFHMPVLVHSHPEILKLLEAIHPLCKHSPNVIGSPWCG